MPGPGLNVIRHFIWGAKHSTFPRTCRRTLLHWKSPANQRIIFAVSGSQSWETKQCGRLQQKLCVYCWGHEARWGKDDGALRMLKGKGTVFCPQKAKPRGFYWPSPCPVPQLKWVYREKAFVKFEIPLGSLCSLSLALYAKFWPGVMLFPSADQSTPSTLQQKCSLCCMLSTNTGLI